MPQQQLRRKKFYNLDNRKTLEESIESIISGAALIADSRYQGTPTEGEGSVRLTSSIRWLIFVNK
jgi:hypothetical protein